MKTYQLKHTYQDWLILFQAMNSMGAAIHEKGPFSNTQIVFYSLADKIAQKIWAKMNRKFSGKKGMRLQLMHIATMHQLISFLFEHELVSKAVREGDPVYNENFLRLVLADLDKIKVNHQ